MTPSARINLCVLIYHTWIPPKNNFGRSKFTIQTLYEIATSGSLDLPDEGKDYSSKLGSWGI